MVGDRKLAGILAERVETPAGPAVVVGVGLNVDVARRRIAGADGDFSRAGRRVDASTEPSCSAAFCRAVARDYAEWRGGRRRRCCWRYRERCVTLGRDVRVELPGGSCIEGRAVDVDSDGSLVVETAAGRRSVTAGDVVHVR